MTTKAELLELGPYRTWGQKGRRKVRRYLRQRDGNRCALCGGILIFGVPAHWHGLPIIDHKTARRLGGTDDPDNLQLVHHLCGFEKDIASLRARAESM